MDKFLVKTSKEKRLVAERKEPDEKPLKQTTLHSLKVRRYKNICNSQNEYRNKKLEVIEKNILYIQIKNAPGKQNIT